MVSPFALLGFIPNLLGYWQKKQEMRLRWFELIFSVAKDILMFFWRFKRIIFIALILGYCLIQYIKAVNYGDSEKHQKIIARKALSDYVEAANAAAKERDAENAIKHQLANQAIADANSKLDKALKDVGLLNVKRDTLKRKLENEKTYLADVLNNAYELRVNANAAIANSVGVREVARSPEEIAESARNCERTLVTVTEACQATTIDYNILRAYNDENCRIYGCRPADDEPIIDFGSIEKVD